MYCVHVVCVHRSVLIFSCFQPQGSFLFSFIFCLYSFIKQTGALPLLYLFSHWSEKLHCWHSRGQREGDRETGTEWENEKTRRVRRTGRARNNTAVNPWGMCDSNSNHWRKDGETERARRGKANVHWKWFGCIPWRQFVSKQLQTWLIWWFQLPLQVNKIVLE